MLEFFKPDSISPKMSTIRQVTAAEPAPTILIHISTNKRSYQTQVLPDSDAVISAAGYSGVGSSVL